MSKIKFCALGGLGENGKNLYVVSVDGKFFILDAGIKYPSVDLYGVDAVIPDFEYLVDNKEKVFGIFVSHGHEENCGAIPELLKALQVPVYGSHFTISIIEQMLIEKGMKVEDYKLFRINDDKELKFGNVSVTFFYTTHSVPESLGVSINTVDGSVVYIPDFSLGFTKDYHYQTSFNKLSEISKNKCLMLCAESLGVNNFNRVKNDYNFNHIVNDALQDKNRVIFTMFSSDLNRIQKVVDLCIKNKRKVAIIGRKVQRIVNVAMNTDYLKIPSENLVNLRFLDERVTNEYEDLAVIITGIRHEPFFMLQRMMTDQDKLIKISKRDTVVTICPPAVGTEKMATRVLDQLSKIGSKVINISRTNLRSSHADSEDLKLVYQILKPQYIVPVIGEYRHQYLHKNIAIDAGYSEDKILVLDNGRQIVFENGILSKTIDKVPVSDVLVDGSVIGDINEVVLKDREQLSEEGAMLVVTNIDSKRCRVISGPSVYTKGFRTFVEFQRVQAAIANVTLETINMIFRTREVIDWNELKNMIRENCTREVRVITRKSPIVIPVIIDINGEDL